MSSKTYVSWADFDDDMGEFIKFINQFKFNENSIIIGLKRGGLPAAVSLSNRLNIPISLVSFQTRDGNQTTPVFLEPHMITKDTKIIIPDDIYDSGYTIETVVHELVNTFNIPINNIMGLFQYYTDYMVNTELKYYRCIKNNNNLWVQFPWEK